LVGLEAPVGVVQRRRGGPVDGIAAVLAVDRDQRSAAAPLIADSGRLAHQRGSVATGLSTRAHRPLRRPLPATAPARAAQLRGTGGLARLLAPVQKAQQ